MAWSYRKRIKIIPGVHLNLSKRGISTSIGIKGASITFGPSGTYLNTSVPLLGVYNRKKISNPKERLQPQAYDPIYLDAEDNIFSADIQEITSQDMNGFKEAILLARQQRKELCNDLLKTKLSLIASKTSLVTSYILVFGLIKKSIAHGFQQDISSQRSAIQQIKEQIENCYVNLDIEMDSHLQEKYERVFNSFKLLTTSQKIWDVTSARYQDRVAARSSASTIVNKKEVKFSTKSLPDIKANYEALYFQNANGADLYFYPSFVVMYSSINSFAIIGLDEIELYFSHVRFTENGSVPRDSKIIDKTWLKVNKNGTRDKRFKGNYQIPVVKYGEIRLGTSSGLHEEYEFSNYEYMEEFGYAFREYQSNIKSIKKL